MNAKKLRCGALASILAVAGCAGGRDDGRYVEDLLTIDQGIYGQITLQGDYAAAEPAPLSDVGVVVYAVPPIFPEEGPSDGDLGAPIARTTSGERGFYEIALVPDTYKICTSADRCIDVTVPEGLLRADCGGGRGGRWWLP